jgi:hypothetical protein
MLGGVPNILDGIRFTLAVILATLPGTALAEAPYVTDSAEPTDYRHFVVNAFSEGVSAPDKRSDSTGGIEVNYGVLPNFEITAALPVGFSAPARANVQFELTMMELGIKYRFLEEDEDGWKPQISFYPSVEFAVAGGRPQESSTREFLPLWAQKSLGAWTIFGGGGLLINSGPDGRNSWLTGIALTRAITPGFEAGAEIVHETAEAWGEDDTTRINFGAKCALNNNLRLVGSAGPVVSAQNTFSYYVGIEWAM